MAAATFMTDLVEIVTQAAEAAAMIGSLWSSAKMVSQARSYYNLYNAQKQFYYSVFQRGAEAPLAAGVYGEAVVPVDYSGAVGELYLTTGIFGGSMSDISGWWSRHGAMFGTAQSPSLLNDELPVDQQLIWSQWANVMFRFEESNVDLLNDQRWDHRMKLHNVAMKRQSEVVSELASGAGLREEVMTKTSGYLADVAGSLAERRGLVQAHKDVQARYAELTNGSGSVYASRPRASASYRDPTGRSGSVAQAFPLGTMPSGNDHFRPVP